MTVAGPLLIVDFWDRHERGTTDADSRLNIPYAAQKKLDPRVQKSPGTIVRGTHPSKSRRVGQPFSWWWMKKDRKTMCGRAPHADCRKTGKRPVCSWVFPL